MLLLARNCGCSVLFKLDQIFGYNTHFSCPSDFRSLEQSIDDRHILTSLSARRWRSAAAAGVIFYLLVPFFDALVPLKYKHVRDKVLSPHIYCSISRTCDEVFLKQIKKFHVFSFLNAQS